MDERRERVHVYAQCGGCQRQFDTEGRPPGQLFHCACGELLRVPTPAARPQAPTRCSGCGAPREGASTVCTHCGVNLLFDDDDVDGSCPLCQALMPRGARFCPGCAVALTAPRRLGESAGKGCPSCGHGATLHRCCFAEGRIDALECGRCGGLWLSQSGFAHLVDAAELGALPAAAQEAPDDEAREQAEASLAAVARPKKVSASSQANFYRKCPTCQEVMRRLNYAQTSGVILDVCAKHGVWFDDDELQAVLRFVAEGQVIDESVRKTGQLEIIREQERRARDAARASGGLSDADTDVAPLVQMGNAMGQLMEGTLRLVIGVFTPTRR